MRFSPRPNQAHEIEWQPWVAAPFKRAQDEDKPVLLSISAVWCHWCHVMDETSFSDSEVIHLINRDFVAVRVDSDQRPDVNSRYNMGGWPTIAFLTPNGDVITGTTYMEPGQFKAALEQVSSTYTRRKPAILARALEVKRKREETASGVSAGHEVDGTIVDAVVAAVVSAYDSEYGGFGVEPKFPMVAGVELLLRSYQPALEPKYRHMAESTLDGMMKGGLYDHEEGGFFRYSTTRDWSVPHFEKMLEDNAGLLRLYLRGHLAMGRGDYAAVASRTADYLDGHLYDDESGAFHGSQDADEEYYALSVGQRRKHRAPGTDPNYHTGPNGMAVSAYLEASWVLNRPDLADKAFRTLDYFLRELDGGTLCHGYPTEVGPGIPALLTDYAYLTTALVDAYFHTSRGEYLDAANRLGGEMIDIFCDGEAGGFFDIPEDPGAIGNLAVRDKPIGDNVAAVDALINLYSVTHRPKYREVAETALSAFVPLYGKYGEAAAGYGVAVQRLLNAPIEISVVGQPGAPDTEALVLAAATVPYPHVRTRLIDTSDPERLAAEGYWPGDPAQVFICLDTVCLAPVSEPGDLHKTVTEFLDARGHGGITMIQSL